MAEHTNRNDHMEMNAPDGQGRTEHHERHEHTEHQTHTRTKGVRGGTPEQHAQAGRKGGQRVRQLIELGYKYEQEHGIGPDNERGSRGEENGSENRSE